MGELGVGFIFAVGKYKSVWRAWRRGHIDNNGNVIPKRPFNNRSNRFGTRFQNESKKQGVWARAN